MTDRESRREYGRAMRQCIWRAFVEFVGEEKTEAIMMHEFKLRMNHQPPPWRLVRMRKMMVREMRAAMN